MKIVGHETQSTENSVVCWGCPHVLIDLSTASLTRNEYEFVPLPLSNVNQDSHAWMIDRVEAKPKDKFGGSLVPLVVQVFLVQQK